MTCTSGTARHFLGLGAALAVAVLAVASTGAAQPADNATLRQQVERRFDVLPLQNGVALRPKDGAHGVRSVEIAAGTVAIDGAPATGAELRQKLGADADLVLRLTYLDAETRRALFAPSSGAPSAATAVEPPAPPVSPPPPAERRRPARRTDARVRLGGSITVEPDEIVQDSVVVIGGSADVQGEVDGDVVAIGGSIDLGPHAVVSRDVTVVGGVLRRQEGSRIGGKINEIGVGRLTFDQLRFRRVPFGPLMWWGDTWSSAFRFMSTLMRFAVLAILASLVVLFGREQVERIGARAAAAPIKAGLVGLLAELLFVPLLVVAILFLVVTIIGIPLLVLIPFALLGLGVICLVGFTAVAYDVGRAVGAKFGWADPNPYVTAVIGILVVMLPVLLARLLRLGGGWLSPMTTALALVGFLFEYAAWTVGVGAAALTRLDRRRPVVAPPVQP